MRRYDTAFLSPKTYSKIKKTLLILIAVFCALSNARALEISGNEIERFNQLVADRGKGWLCYWQVNVWDGAPSDPATKVIPGLSGYSEIEITDQLYPSGSTQCNVFIKDFIDGYVYEFAWWRDPDGLTEDNLKALCFESMKNEFDKVGFIRNVTAMGANDRTSNTYDISAPNNMTKLNPIRMEAIGENDLSLEWGNTGESANGLLLVSNWTGSTSGKYEDQRNSATFRHIVSMEFTLVRTDDFDRAALSSIADDRDFIVKCAGEIAEDGSAALLVDNLYHKGKNMTGEMLDYVNTGNGTSYAPVRLLVDTDGGVRFENASPGMLEFSPVKVSCSDKGLLTGTLYTGSVSSDLYFTDYLVISEEEYDRPSEYGYIKDLAPCQEDEKLKPFYNRILDKDLEAPTGSWTLAADNTLKSAWDRKDNRPLSVTFGPHYLVPVYYRYNRWGYIYSEGRIPLYYIFRVGEPIRIQSLTLETGVPTPEIRFEVTRSGHGRISDTSPDDYIYLEGTLISQSTLTELYLVKGRIEDYADEAITNDGHSGAVKLTGRYEYPGAMPATKVFSEREGTPGQTFAFLIPEKDLPQGDGATEYTVFAKYDGFDGSSRFRVLAVVERSDMTTSVGSTPVSPSCSFTVTGNTVHACNGGVTVTDLAGRKICRIPAGGYRPLPGGIYFVHPDASPKECRKIIIK